MQRIDRDAAAVKPLGEIDGKHDLGKLALAIGARAAVAVRQHHVGKVDRLLSERGDVDDARGRAFADQRQKQMREQEAGEVVHGEAQFVAVGAGLPRPLRPAAADAGIVDEKIEPLRGLLHRTGQPAYLGKAEKGPRPTSLRCRRRP